MLLSDCITPLSRTNISSEINIGSKRVEDVSVMRVSSDIKLRRLFNNIRSFKLCRFAFNKSSLKSPKMIRCLEEFIADSKISLNNPQNAGVVEGGL